MHPLGVHSAYPWPLQSRCARPLGARGRAHPVPLGSSGDGPFETEGTLARRGAEHSPRSSQARRRSIGLAIGRPKTSASNHASRHQVTRAPQKFPLRALRCATRGPLG